MELSEPAVIGERLRRGLLHPGGPAADPVRVVASLCGVQAQELPAARLAIRARSAGLTDRSVEEARERERSFVRTWAMRGTLHLVAAQDLAWLRRLFLPAAVRGSARRSDQLGLDEATYRRAMEVIEEALSQGRALARSALRDHLARHGVDSSGQRAAYLLFRASAEGLICEGPAAGREPSYVLVREWLGPPEPDPGDRPADLVNLATRYLGAYGPAGPEDLAAWSGFGIKECRQAVRLAGDRLTGVTLAGRPMWVVGPPGEEPERGPARLKLLPSFDPFLLGYRDRSLHLDPGRAALVNAGGGIVRPVVLLDGRVAGTWQLVRRPRLRIEVRPFAALPRSVQGELEAEVDDVGRFLGAPAALSVKARSGQRLQGLH